MFKGELNPKTDLSSFEHLGIVKQLWSFFKLLAEQFRKMWSAAQYEMSAVVYDVG